MEVFNLNFASLFKIIIIIILILILIMTYYIYISFYLCIFICLFLEVKSFTPITCHSHSSVLVENKLYIISGDIITNNLCSNEVFYLDVSQPFNLQAPPWNDLTSSARIPFKSCWAAA